MSNEYKHCPVCGTLCTIGGDDKEGTHYYMPIASTDVDVASKKDAEIDRLSWLSSGDDEIMKTYHAKLSGLTFVVEENSDGASLRIVLDRESYQNIYDAERGAQSILDEMLEDYRKRMKGERE